MIKEGKERKKQEEGRCVGEATVTHYFPHRRQRWSSTFLCLREFGREVPHSHPSCNTHTQIQHTHRHTLTFQTEHGSSLYCNIYPPETNSTSSSLPPTLLHPLYFFLRSVGPKRLRTETQIPTHTRTPLSPAASRHRSPSLAPPRTHTHTRSGEWPTSAPQGPCLVTPRVCSTSLPLSTSPPSQKNFSTLLTRPPLLPKPGFGGSSPA